MNAPSRPAASAAPPLWEQYRAQLEAFSKAKVNYDLARVDEYTAEAGWRLDDYGTELPAEPPGPPLPDGSWAAAKQVLLNYSFPPPDLITGIFVPDQPLAERVMLLRAQFLGFTFWFGVRIGGVVDETRTTPDGPEQVWGYNYRTLEGHFEKGEITFTVHKQERTGRVLFRVKAYSQPDRIRNPFYRIGFKLFGRTLQRKFARESLRRLKQLVVEQLRNGKAAVLAD
ncbi:DUF1990 domain-containing protein [Hymenobacter busanensis]|uniref:DUF1990 domain-containing protein n=1 Tax=Hymenobacter busanensis TaxID=2607656 RepID=A0A7L4ZVY5_9BACT|nr:DUF1990 domain-containing protein [Hymenobacter busanensis]KAA9332058.1 DUF1990 domain-containing protein [Hymenobacter busanensis]QHJ07604.1 DUF1990 family protein [Hymenobacter busanensis]